MLRASSSGLRLPQATRLAISRCRLCKYYRRFSGMKTGLGLVVQPRPANALTNQPHALAKLLLRLDGPTKRQASTDASREEDTGEESSETVNVQSRDIVPHAHVGPQDAPPSTPTGQAPNADLQDPLERFKESELNEPYAAAKIKGILKHSENAFDFWGRTSVPIQDQPTRARKELQRGRLLKRLSDAKTLDDAWDAYLDRRSIPDPPPMSLSYLHRLAALIASVSPRTRARFLQLYSVFSSIERAGGTPFLWERNALMDFAVPDNSDDDNRPDTTQQQHGAEIQPDVYSHTTLLNIAGRTKESGAMRHARKLFRLSQIVPNRITHLVMLRYFTSLNDSKAIRHTMSLLLDLNITLDIAAINAIIWAFAKTGRLELAWNIYRVLRCHLMPEEGTAEEDGEDIHVINARLLQNRMSIPRGMVPDHVTYHIIIQACVYHGDAVRALQTFIDMLSTTIRRPSVHDEEPRTFPPTMTAYRAFFHGFALHGPSPTAPDSIAPFVTKGDWNLQNLELIFENFLELPDGMPSHRTVWWIIVAFVRTSNADVDKLRSMWSRLENRFPGHWGGRVWEFKEIIDPQNLVGRDVQRVRLLHLLFNYNRTARSLGFPELSSFNILKKP
ncbi:hypothetical protein OE88DRAFT_1673415 [Heliocybe sulcata]|uniref:Pentatricopeptide repeat protein n=1 Tax=Heliocybe sulcata TaxID=5364 RepID=A0A5C3NFN9_9AGAM|nr:hypothetical protein OE88DRAFT_1673415 [Heliocybe sulcata]